MAKYNQAEQKQIQDQSSQLWKIANKLRGSMDASEYKNYILGLLFYRYLSERFEEKLPELGISYEQYESEYADLIQDHAFISQVYTQIGYLIAPKFAWKKIIAAVQEATAQADLFAEMFKNFRDLTAQVNLVADIEPTVKANAEALKDIFNDIDANSNRLGATAAARTKLLSDLVLLINDLEYRSDDKRDLLGDIYENQIKLFAENMGKKAGEFYTPHNVSRVLAKIVTSDLTAKRLQGSKKQEQAFNIYDPTCGSGSLLLTVQDEFEKVQLAAKTKSQTSVPVHFYGQELNQTTYSLARMNLMMHNVELANIHLNNADTLDTDWPLTSKHEPQKFDAIVSNPPYSAHWDPTGRLEDPRFAEYGRPAPKTYADFAFVLHSLYHLADNGKFAVVLPHGVLFRGGDEGVIRRCLIEKNYIDAVIGLPKNLFFATTIPTVIIVLRKDRGKNKDVLFIDASKDFEKGKKQNLLPESAIERIIDTYLKRASVDKYSALVSFETLKENDFTLNIPRYVDTFEEEEPIDLEQVIRDIHATKLRLADIEQQINEQLKDLGVDVEAIIAAKE
ncbi:type I restriction-modification system subunit M [Psittacicella hinzii]|uniref:site-specific DNA-methyltransferase (adenine-specific) n=1 Tax=Psittacicella hinzii TaxID=2028575 RepID=A0A3A1YIB7_9GAMM|nr:type I restriction-modification system subunit M [Psittacicella hinzii]RIY37902.1 type I restriction-modification system subunit M [Psittacicella hinzii]